jgi:homoserine kinase
LVVARVSVPATSANLGPGYDVMSVALESPRLEVEVEPRVEEGIELTVTGKYAEEVVRDTSLNSACRALRLFTSGLSRPKGWRIRIEAGIPVRKGLGSSAAEAVGALLAAHAAIGMRFARKEVARMVALVEPGGHADNVAAAALGGFTVVFKNQRGLDVMKIRPPERLGFVVVIPDVSKESTGSSRKVVPKSVTMEDHVMLTSRVAAMVVCIERGDLRRLFELVVYDPLVERARADAGLYGRYRWRELLREKERLLRKYGVAMTISGAGPSRLLWYDLRRNTQEEGKRPIDGAVNDVVSSLESKGHRVLEVIWTRPGRKGAEIVNQ